MIAKGVPATSILAMTFTNQGCRRDEGTHRPPRAGRGRRRKLDGRHVPSFCVKALRQFADQAGIRKNFGICDADDPLVAIKQAMRQFADSGEEDPARVCLARYPC